MKKYEINAVVVSQKEISTNIFDMWIEAEEIAAGAAAGQFISLYTSDSGKLLPRPISICEIDKGTGRLRLTYRVTGKNTGTELFSKLDKGDTIRVLGPLGTGFPTLDGESAILIGGGIGIPPMLELAKERKGKSTLVAGYNDETYLEDDLKQFGELYIATETGSMGIKGNIIDVIKEKNLKAEVIYACGPMPMLRAVKQYASESGAKKCYISLEERMACGIGACLGCICKSEEIDFHTNVKNKRVCKEGPVFSAWEVEL